MDRLMLGPKFLKELEYFVTKVQVNLKEAQDRQKSYMDKKRKDKYYQIDDYVYVKVKAKWSSLSLGRCGKLAPRFCRPFEYWPREDHSLEVISTQNRPFNSN